MKTHDGSKTEKAPSFFKQIQIFWSENNKHTMQYFKVVTAFSRVISPVTDFSSNLWVKFLFCTSQYFTILITNYYKLHDLMIEMYNVTVMRGRRPPELAGLKSSCQQVCFSFWRPKGISIFQPFPPSTGNSYSAACCAFLHLQNQQIC